MRSAFSKALTDAARRDERVVLLTGDHGYALFDEFRKSCPSQYLNAGVAEQNMVGVAAGLAKGGFRPVVYGLGAFVPIRVLEQVKIDICFEGLPVLLIGDGAGLVYSQLGTSHQTTEDIAAVRALPRISIFSPADRFEMDYCMQAALDGAGPAYLRMGKADLGDVHAQAPRAAIGSLLPLTRGHHAAAIVATGSMVRPCLDIARQLGGIDVWSAPAIKPLDEAQVARVCAKASVVVTVEEHSIYGGLGGAIAEIASARHPVRVVRLGIRDRFAEVCGSYAHLLEVNGLDRASLERAIRDACGRDEPARHAAPAPAVPRR